MGIRRTARPEKQKEHNIFGIAHDCIIHVFVSEKSEPNSGELNMRINREYSRISLVT